MVYTETSGPSPRLFFAVGASGPDIDLTALFADRAGTMRLTAEVRLPAGWLWCDGAPWPRATYPDLFNNICPSFQGTVTNGSTVITSVSENFTLLGGNGGIVGAVVEGLGIGGLVVTAVGANTLTLSGPATQTPTPPVSLRAFPYGNGNGSTTFNVPNCKGRVVIGRSDMGPGPGTDSGLINVGGAGFDGTRLNASGGAQSIGLVPANLPSHAHSASSSGTITLAPHTHTVTGRINIPPHNHAPSGGGNFVVSNQAPSTMHWNIAPGANVGLVGFTDPEPAQNLDLVGGTADSRTVTGTVALTTNVDPSPAPTSNVRTVQPSIVGNMVIKT